MRMVSPDSGLLPRGRVALSKGSALSLKRAEQTAPGAGRAGPPAPIPYGSYAFRPNHSTGQPQLTSAEDVARPQRGGKRNLPNLRATTIAAATTLRPYLLTSAAIAGGNKAFVRQPKIAAAIRSRADANCPFKSKLCNCSSLTSSSTPNTHRKITTSTAAGSTLPERGFAPLTSFRSKSVVALTAAGGMLGKVSIT
jgi:hypothetical protein